MKLKQHIEIGRVVYKELSEQMVIEPEKRVLLKIPFLIGNIAPDINCVYPAHRLNTTEKRFYKKLKFTASTDSLLMKSFILGIITHYICDYFCYAHNNESLGVKHKKYETNLWNYYKAHLSELEETPNKIRKLWIKNKRISIDNNCVSTSLSTEDQCKMIFEQLKRMNTEYMQHTEVSKRFNWEHAERQLRYDMQYIIFMAKNIDSLIMEPFRCLVVMS